MPAAGSAGVYDLSRLGWLLFEELCAVWLERTAGVPEAAWEGSADRERLVVVEEPVPGVDLAPPLTVTALWVRPPGVVELALTAQARRVLILSNAPSSAWPDDLHGAGRELRVLGAAELGAAIDADPELRLRVPSVLGVRREPVAPADLRSTLDAGQARALAERFVPTRAYRRAVAVLEAHDFCVLTGPPEMGKTAAARMIGLALTTAGWEAHECTRPEQVLERLRPDARQLFIADDAFGSTEYRPDAADRWARALPAILAATDARHRLIWTSRPTPLKAGLRRIRRERGAERFPLPGEVRVDAADLDLAEKALILFRHALAARLPEPALELVRAHGAAIVAHPHFTPERIRRFVQTRLPELAADSASEDELADAVDREIERPTEAMAASFRALGPAHKAVLVAMLDSPPSLVSERELAAAARRHVPAGLERSPVELVDRLTDHFLRLLPPTTVTWVHPSWRDLVIEELAGDDAARHDFLRTCGHHGALLALSTGGGPSGHRSLPLLVQDGDWDALADRLPELLHAEGERELTELLGALRAANEETGAPDAGELRSLAELALHVAARGRSDHEPASLSLLEEWLRLAAVTPDAPPPPWIGATWIELLPTEPPRIDDRAELARYDDWLALVELLSELRPEALERLGFPGDQLRIARDVARAATRLIHDRPTSPEAEALSHLILRLMPLFRADMPGWELAEAIQALVPGGGPIEPGPEPPPAWERGTAGLVARVLADLR